MKRYKDKGGVVMSPMGVGVKLGKRAIKDGVSELDDLLDIVDEHCIEHMIVDNVVKNMIGEYAMIYFARHA